MKTSAHHLIAIAAMFATAFSGCSIAGRLTPGGPDSTANAGAAMASASDELPAEQSVQVCIATAERLAGEGHAREAILLYEKARRLDPQAANISRRLAGLYDLSGDAAHANIEFQAAVAAAPGDADLLNDAGCFYDRLGDFVQAERLLRQALAASPQHARAQTNLGITLAHQGRFQEAFDAFAAVVGPAAAHSNVGTLLARQGRDEEARHAFAQALALDSQLAQAKLATEYLHQRRPPATADR
jgi:Tfp pilus assembly protein PilF